MVLSLLKKRPALEPVTDFFTFDIRHLEKLAETYKDQYYNNEPFPHVVIDNFLPEVVADQILALFPDPNDEAWLNWKKRDTVHQPKKQGIGTAERLEGVPRYLQQILHAFNTFPMIHFLEKLTGIEALIPDPDYWGGGLHQILSGGKLAVHTDFNYHERMKIYRRINCLLYLNKDWQEDYNGQLELWEPDMSKCVKKVMPHFNRLVVFNTTNESYHGHPEPLNAPKGVTRKSLAFYYYTKDPKPGDEEIRLTGWRDRPEDTNG